MVNFHQSIDRKRPHTCVTADPVRSSQITYRYDDTQELVTVPNVWYNWTHRSDSSAMCWEAKKKEEAATRFQMHPMPGLSDAAVAQIVDRYRRVATNMRQQANCSNGLNEPIVEAAR